MSEKIPKGWKWVKLGEVLNSGLFELLDRYRIPLSDNQRNKMKDGILYPYYGANGIIDYVNRYIFDGEFILVAEDGTVSTDKGKPVVQYVCGKFWVSNHAHVIKCENSITLKFLYYALKNVDIIPYITGAVQPKLNQRNLLDIEILYALDINEQKAIAEVLSSIDDKIDLLHRQNKTLEEMAMTLFRQWFIEPTKDGLPEGWEEKALDEIAEFLNGIPSQKYHGDKLPVIKIKEMREGITESSDYCNNNVPEKYLVNSGDILFSWSGSLEVVIWFGSIGVLNQHIFKVTSLEYPKWFCYLSIKQHIEEFRAIAESKTTTMGHIQREHLSNTKVFIPPKIFFENYNKAMTPFFDKIIANNAEIQTLEKLRDTLLPKLMSGEMRVKF